MVILTHQLATRILNSRELLFTHHEEGTYRAEHASNRSYPRIIELEEAKEFGPELNSKGA